MFKVSSLPRTLQAAERDLASSEERVRLEAVLDLGRRATTEEAMPRAGLLVGALSDPSPSVRRQAALSLADLGATGALPQLLAALADPELSVRQMVVLALGELATSEDGEVIGRLASLLAAGAPAIRFQALSAYAGLLGERSRSEILRALADDDLEVRELAVRLLEEVVLPAQPEDGDVRDALRRSCEAAEPRVAVVAQLACAEWAIPAPHGLLSQVVSGALRAREPRDEQLAIELCGKLGLHEAEAALKRRAFGRWGISFDPFAWPALTALARWGNPKAIARIERALDSSSPLKRNLAVQAIGDAVLVDQRSRLEALAPGSCDAEVLEAALDALRRS